MQGCSNVAENGSMGTKNCDKIGGVQKTLQSWWQTGVAHSVGKIGDYVRPVVGEHSQEADHFAKNLEAEGRSKITIEGVKKTAV